MRKEVGKSEQRYFLIYIAAGLFFAGMAIYAIFTMWEFIPWQDEAATILAIDNFLKEGYPRVGAHIETINYVNQPVTRVFWEYSLELILRLPVRMIEMLFATENLQAISNLLFWGILYIISIFKLRKIKDLDKDFYNVLSLSMIFMALTPWIMSIFHYVRYYAFSATVFYFSVITISVILGTNKQLTLKQIVLVLFLAMIPIPFHLIYILYFAAIMILLMKHLWTNKKYLNYKEIIKRNQGFLFLLFFFLVLACFGGITIISRILKTNNSFFIGETLQAFLKNAVALNVQEAIIAVLGGITLVVYYRRHSRIIQNVINVTAINLAIGALVSFVIGTQMWENNRYFISYKISYFILLAVLIVTIAQIASKIINRLIRVWREGIYFFSIVCIMLLVVVLNSESMQREFMFSYMIPRQDLNQLKSIVEEIELEDNGRAILFTDGGHSIYSELPNVESYLFRDYEDADEVNKAYHNGSVYVYKDENGFLHTDNGQVYAGKGKDFEKILARCENPENTYIVFWIAAFDRIDVSISNILKENEWGKNNYPIKVSDMLKAIAIEKQGGNN